MTCVKAFGLVVLAALLACFASAPGHAECGRPDHGGLPNLPVVAPAPDGTLTLNIRAERMTGPVMIGDLPVADVPVFIVQPEAGTQLRGVDAFGNLASPLEARCLTTPEQIYAGSIWALSQGSRLRVTLTSALDFRAGELPRPPAGAMNCNGINLHTHGLLVSPARRTEPDGSQTIGDQAFDLAVPPGAGDEDACAPGGTMMMGGEGGHHGASGVLNYAIQIPGQPGQSGRDDAQHPSGLFWFHPHTHGYSAALTGGGMSGLITVGNLSDYVCVMTVKDCGKPEGLPVRTLVLKDAEILPDHTGWRLAHDRVYALEDACAQSPGKDEARQGECRDYRGRRWLFTVNGARYPRIDSPVAARAEIWRIVNASPNMSYRLRLRPLDPDHASQALPLRILTLEGAAPAPSRAVAPNSVQELLLMPASRAEIAVVPPPSGGDFILEQQAFATGGDTWPRALLAQWHVPAAPIARAADDTAARLRLRAAGPARPAVQHQYGPTAEPSCDYPPGSLRRIMLVARPSFSDDRRRPTKFGLIAALESSGNTLQVFGADGWPVPFTRETWDRQLARDPDAPAFMHNPFGTVCTYVGHTETWIIDNYTAEAHNFHIHQTEFRLAEALRSDPAYFSPEPANSLGTLQRQSDAAIEAADMNDRAGDGASAYRDTVPIPRGVSKGGRGCDGAVFNEHCQPGRITLIVRFDREAQVGTFVYHCHILQHEDGGMMAIMKVLCPPGDKACAARHPDSDSRVSGVGMPPQPAS